MSKRIRKKKNTKKKTKQKKKKTTNNKTTKTKPNKNNKKKKKKEKKDRHKNRNYKTLRKIMNNDATFRIPRAEKVVVQTKPDIVDAMKTEGGVKQNCEAKYEVVAKSSALVMVRVDFCYDNCIQQNYLVLEKNDDKQWKIAQVYKIFNDQESGLSVLFVFVFF